MNSQLAVNWEIAARAIVLLDFSPFLFFIVIMEIKVSASRYM
jgi:hypothetical protein